MTWTDGQKYDGEWKDDQPDGKGNFNWPNGDRYLGDWKDGQRNG